MNNFEVKLIEYDSNEYKKELKLRDKILRKPLGLDLFSEDLSQDEFDIHIGAFLENEIAGCLLLQIIDENTLKMRQVAVDEKHQRAGIGSAMVSFAEKYALKNSYSAITMHARKTAVNFYTKLGYQIVSDEFFEVRVPHHSMKKELHNTSDFEQGRLCIKPVTLYTLSEFIEILKEAAYWMISNGFRNWDPANFTKDRILDSNKLNELFICYIDDEAAGCIKLQNEDKIFWPDVNEDEALYIHKLAVKRKFAGKGISSYMLDWSYDQAVYRKKKYLRLDCISNRAKLCAFYINHGFSKMDERQVFGSVPSARFEKKVYL